MVNAPTQDQLAYVAAARFGRLATANANGEPSVVPCCFAVVDLNGVPAIAIALDAKPKSVPVRELRRVRDIMEHPHVALVVDRDDEDWSKLSFVMVRGVARLWEPGDPTFDRAIEALREKYAQYAGMPIDQHPMIVIEALSAASWNAAESELPDRPRELQALTRGRRSVRSLSPQPVERALIEQAIAAAGWAPSPHGRQPWRFAVVERAERKCELADAMAESWREQLALDGQDTTVIELRLSKSRTRLLTAPVIVVPCLFLGDLDEYPDPDRQTAERTMAVQSLGAAIQNFLLSIYASGLDSGWMCAPLFCPEVVRDTLRLSRDLIPQALLPVGRAENDPVRRPRMPLERLIAAWD